MASKEQRDKAIKAASKTVLSWPSYMHAASCACVKCEARRMRWRGEDDTTGGEANG